MKKLVVKIKENKKELFSKKQHGLEAQLTIHAVF